MEDFRYVSESLISLIDEIKSCIERKDFSKSQQSIEAARELLIKLEQNVNKDNQNIIVSNRRREIESLSKYIENLRRKIIDIPENDSPNEGLLGHFGYHVGQQSNLGVDKRRKILEDVYSVRVGTLPERSFSQSYLNKWGDPESEDRLQKMSKVIAALCRNARAKAKDGQDFDEAIHEWEADLEYLQKKYYEGRCHFSWPSTF
jgi:hypothetical protein